MRFGASSDSFLTEICRPLSVHDPDGMLGVQSPAAERTVLRHRMEA